MAASKDVILKGKLSWHNLVQPDEEMKWKCRIYLDADSLAKVNELKKEGLMNVLKKDEEGYSMQFTRYRQKSMKGVIKVFDPPIVLNNDNQPMEGIGLGHGSDVAIKLQVYPFNKPGGGKGIAARLEALRIFNLIAYEPERDATTNQKRQFKGLPSVLETVWD
jgi:hypothetical protein